MTHIVSVQQVFKNYTLGTFVVPALRGVSLDVEEGEFLAIAGPSGSGKTTLLNLIGCVDTPTAGVVRIAGNATETMSEQWAIHGPIGKRRHELSAAYKKAQRRFRVGAGPWWWDVEALGRRGCGRLGGGGPGAAGAGRGVGDDFVDLGLGHALVFEVRLSRTRATCRASARVRRCMVRKVTRAYEAWVGLAASAAHFPAAPARNSRTVLPPP